MSHKKLTPFPAERSGKLCPVCGKRAYSRGGVHPQCAVVQADAPRKLRLAAEKKAQAEAKQLELARQTDNGRGEAPA